MTTQSLGARYVGLTRLGAGTTGCMLFVGDGSDVSGPLAAAHPYFLWRH